MTTRRGLGPLAAALEPGCPFRVRIRRGVGVAGDLRREEPEAVFQDGAWHEAFEEWAEYTDLTEEDIQIIRDLGLIQQFDFFWDPSEERLRFETPDVPADWRERTDVEPSDARGVVSRLEGELSDLGHTVVEMLEDAYVDWGEGEPSDYVWSEETFAHGAQE